jgi:hypothetical protein
LFNRQEPGVGSEVHFGHLVVLTYLKAEEPRPFPNASDVETCVLKRALDGGHQSVDIRGSGTEEIEITSLTFDVPSGDQRRPSGKGKLLCLRKSADDRCDSALEER